jgi:hypothetical protein
LPTVAAPFDSVFELTLIESSAYCWAGVRAQVNSALQLLAIDVGAESGRAVVGHFDGARLPVERCTR